LGKEYVAGLSRSTGGGEAAGRLAANLGKECVAGLSKPTGDGEAAGRLAASLGKEYVAGLPNLPEMERLLVG